MEMVNTLKRLAHSIIILLALGTTADAAVRLYTQTGQPATCNVGDLWVDTNGTSGERLYTCESANTWAKHKGLGASDSPVFAAANLGTASTTTGVLYFYGNAKAFPFGIYSQGADAPSVGWRLPSTIPAATSFVTVDSNGYWDYVTLSTIATTTGSASSMTLDASGFNGNLAITDNTIQKIAQKVDDLVLGSGGGYTNLTEFLGQTAWRLFYSDGSGDVKELALGSDGEYLKSNGAALAPSWAIPSGAAHDAVTLDANLGNNLLGLSTQQLTLDSQTANYVFAAPNGSAGVPSFRALVAADVPTLNQNTTGTAAGITGYSIVTTVGTTGADTNIPTEQAVREAFSALPNLAFDSATLTTTTVGDTDTISVKANTFQGYDADWLGITPNGAALVSAANYAAMKTLLDTDDIQTLTGIAAGTAHLGTFTGTTIADSSTIKTALQSLETSVETKAPSASPVFTASAAIPQGSSPTVDAAGEIAIDLTSDQLIYYGGAKRVLTHKKQIDFAVKTPVDADDFLLFKAQTAITITDIHVIAQGGTSISVDVQECNSAGANCATVDAAITADTDGAEDDGTLSNGAIDAGDWVKVVLGAPSGTINYLAGSIYYVETAD